MWSLQGKPPLHPDMRSNGISPKNNQALPIIVEDVVEDERDDVIDLTSVESQGSQKSSPHATENSPIRVEDVEEGDEGDEDEGEEDVDMSLSPSLSPSFSELYAEKLLELESESPLSPLLQISGSLTPPRLSPALLSPPRLSPTRLTRTEEAEEEYEQGTEQQPLVIEQRSDDPIFVEDLEDVEALEYSRERADELSPEVSLRRPTAYMDNHHNQEVRQNQNRNQAVNQNPAEEVTTVHQPKQKESPRSRLALAPAFFNQAVEPNRSPRNGSPVSRSNWRQQQQEPVISAEREYILKSNPNRSRTHSDEPEKPTATTAAGPESSAALYAPNLDQWGGEDVTTIDQENVDSSQRGHALEGFASSEAGNVASPSSHSITDRTVYPPRAPDAPESEPPVDEAHVPTNRSWRVVHSANEDHEQAKPNMADLTPESPPPRDSQDSAALPSSPTSPVVKRYSNRLGQTVKPDPREAGKPPHPRRSMPRASPTDPQQFSVLYPRAMRQRKNRSEQTFVDPVISLSTDEGLPQVEEAQNPSQPPREAGPGEIKGSSAGQLSKPQSPMEGRDEPKTPVQKANRPFVMPPEGLESMSPIEAPMVENGRTFWTRPTTSAGDDSPLASGELPPSLTPSLDGGSSASLLNPVTSSIEARELPEAALGGKAESERTNDTIFNANEHTDKAPEPQNLNHGTPNITSQNSSSGMPGPTVANERKMTATKENSSPPEIPASTVGNSQVLPPIVTALTTPTESLLGLAQQTQMSERRMRVLEKAKALLNSPKSKAIAEKNKTRQAAALAEQKDNTEADHVEAAREAAETEEKIASPETMESPSTSPEPENENEAVGAATEEQLAKPDSFALEKELLKRSGPGNRTFDEESPSDASAPSSQPSATTTRQEEILSQDQSGIILESTPSAIDQTLSKDRPASGLSPQAILESLNSEDPSIDFYEKLSKEILEDDGGEGSIGEESKMLEEHRSNDANAKPSAAPALASNDVETVESESSGEATHPEAGHNSSLGSSSLAQNPSQLDQERSLKSEGSVTNEREMIDDQLSADGHGGVEPNSESISVQQVVSFTTPEINAQESGLSKGPDLDRTESTNHQSDQLSHPESTDKDNHKRSAQDAFDGGKVLWTRKRSYSLPRTFRRREYADEHATNVDSSMRNNHAPKSDRATAFDRLRATLLELDVADDGNLDLSSSDEEQEDVEEEAEIGRDRESKAEKSPLPIDPILSNYSHEIVYSNSGRDHSAATVNFDQKVEEAGNRRRAHSFDNVEVAGTQPAAKSRAVNERHGVVRFGFPEAQSATREFENSSLSSSERGARRDPQPRYSRYERELHANTPVHHNGTHHNLDGALQGFGRGELDDSDSNDRDAETREETDSKISLVSYLGSEDSDLDTNFESTTVPMIVRMLDKGCAWLEGTNCGLESPSLLKETKSRTPPSAGGLLSNSNFPHRKIGRKAPLVNKYAISRNIAKKGRLSDRTTTTSSEEKEKHDRGPESKDISREPPAGINFDGVEDPQSTRTAAAEDLRVKGHGLIGGPEVPTGPATISEIPETHTNTVVDVALPNKSVVGASMQEDISGTTVAPPPQIVALEGTTAESPGQIVALESASIPQHQDAGLMIVDSDQDVLPLHVNDRHAFDQKQDIDDMFGTMRLPSHDTTSFASGSRSIQFAQSGTSPDHPIVFSQSETESTINLLSLDGSSIRQSSSEKDQLVAILDNERYSGYFREKAVPIDPASPDPPEESDEHEEDEPGKISPVPVKEIGALPEEKMVVTPPAEQMIEQMNTTSQDETAFNVAPLPSMIAQHDGSAVVLGPTELPDAGADRDHGDLVQSGVDEDDGDTEMFVLSSSDSSAVEDVVTPSLKPMPSKERAQAQTRASEEKEEGAEHENLTDADGSLDPPEDTSGNARGRFSPSESQEESGSPSNSWKSGDDHALSSNSIESHRRKHPVDPEEETQDSLDSGVREENAYRKAGGPEVLTPRNREPRNRKHSARGQKEKRQRDPPQIDAAVFMNLTEEERLAALELAERLRNRAEKLKKRRKKREKRMREKKHINAPVNI